MTAKGPLGGPVRKNLAELQAEQRAEVAMSENGPGHQAGDSGFPPRPDYPISIAPEGEQ